MPWLINRRLDLPKVRKMENRMDEFLKFLRKQERLRAIVPQGNGDAWVKTYWKSDDPFGDRDMIEVKAKKYGLKVVDMRGGLLVGVDPVAW